MGFFVNRTKAGYTLLSDGTGGLLNVVSGKAKPATQKAKRDDGAIKKGDTINGIEFIIEIADSENLTPQVYEQGKDGNYGKYVTDSQPLVFPLKCTLFVAGECGESYLALFNNAEALGLSSDIMSGFKAELNIGENKHTRSLVKGDFKAVPGILGMQFDNAEKIDCKLDFVAPVTSGAYGGGAKAQTEGEKLVERIAFINAVLSDASPEQQLFVKLLGVDGTITHVDFIRLMFQ
jgi:hypothetical protein